MVMRKLTLSNEHCQIIIKATARGRFFVSFKVFSLPGREDITEQGAMRGDAKAVAF